jgi:hypothetical protein
VRYESRTRRQPTLKSCEAPDRAQARTRPPCEAQALGRRNLATRNGRQNLGQELPEILDRAQRREVDPETIGRIDGFEGWRQQLHGEGPQQMRLAVE